MAYMAKLKDIRQKLTKQQFQLLVFVVGFAAIGALLLIIGRAAGPYASVEPESAQLSGVTTLSDTTASGGTYLKFGSGQSELPPSGTYPARGSVGFQGDTSTLKVINSTSTAPAGTSWNTTYNYLTVTGSNVTLNKVWVKGGVYVTGGGTITIRDSIVEGGGSWFIFHMTSTAGRLDAENVTFRWKNGIINEGTTGSGVIQITGNHDDTRIVRCDLSGNADGIQMAGDRWVITDNWIHDLAMVGTYPNNTHNDGIQMYNGTGHTIARNRIEIGAQAPYSNGAIFTQGSSIGSYAIRDNFLNGGGYTLHLQNGIAAVTGNVFGPNSLYGTHLIRAEASVSEWSGNCRGDTNGNKYEPCQVVNK